MDDNAAPAAFLPAATAVVVHRTSTSTCTTRRQDHDGAIRHHVVLQRSRHAPLLRRRLSGCVAIVVRSSSSSGSRGQIPLKLALQLVQVGRVGVNFVGRHGFAAAVARCSSRFGGTAIVVLFSFVVVVDHARQLRREIRVVVVVVVV